MCAFIVMNTKNFMYLQWLETIMLLSMIFTVMTELLKQNGDKDLKCLH